MQEVPSRLAWVERPGALAEWLPVAAWAFWPNGAATGFPWTLEATRILGLREWEFLAFKAHFITGLRDVYEHTFDSWGRIDDNWHCWQLLPNQFWCVEQPAQQLDVDLEVADQFLLWRTLHTRLPDELFLWFALDNLLYEFESALIGDFYKINELLKNDHYQQILADLLEHPDFAGVVRQCRNTKSDSPFGEFFVRLWPQRCQNAFMAARAECAVRFEPPVAPLALFERSSTDKEPVFTLNEAIAFDIKNFDRLLDYALTANMMAWRDLMEPLGDRNFRLRSENWPALRRELEREDVSGRIGTLDGGFHSDESLRLILSARLLNLVAPLPLWAALGVARVSRSIGDWRLPLPPEYTVQHARQNRY